MNKLYPWLPAIDNTYYFLVTCKTINKTINYKEVEDIVCINKYSKRLLKEINAKFIVYKGNEVDTILNDVFLSFDRYQAIYKLDFASQHCIYGINDEDVSTFKERKNWIPYYSKQHDSSSSIEYTTTDCYPRASERHVIVNSEFVTSYESIMESNPDFLGWYVYFKVPTHINKDKTLFLYTPHQIYNLYINFIMTKEEIKEFIYQLEKARILNVIPISMVQD